MKKLMAGLAVMGVLLVAGCSKGESGPLPATQESAGKIATQKCARAVMANNTAYAALQRQSAAVGKVWTITAPVGGEVDTWRAAGSFETASGAQLQTVYCDVAYAGGQWTATIKSFGTDVPVS